MNLPKSNVVFSAEEIQARIKELGAQITAEFNDDKPIVCVCVLRASVMFFADLMKYIDSDKVCFDFVTLQSYETAMEVGGMQTTGKIKLIQDMRDKVEEYGDIQLQAYAFLSLTTMVRVNAIANKKYSFYFNSGFRYNDINYIL